MHKHKTKTQKAVLKKKSKWSGIIFGWLLKVICFNLVNFLVIWALVEFCNVIWNLYWSIINGKYSSSMGHMTYEVTMMRLTDVYYKLKELLKMVVRVTLV